MSYRNSNSNSNINNKTPKKKTTTTTTITTTTTATAKITVHDRFICKLPECRQKNQLVLLKTQQSMSRDWLEII